jgi:hypothetical protein
VASVTRLDAQGHSPIGGEGLPRDTPVTELRSRPPALLGKDERPLSSVTRRVVPRAGWNIRILVDLEPPAEFLRPLAEALDLHLLVPELLSKLRGLIGSEDDLVTLNGGSEPEVPIPSDHLPSGRGLATSRIYNLGTSGIGATVTSRWGGIPRGG